MREKEKLMCWFDFRPGNLHYGWTKLRQAAKSYKQRFEKLSKLNQFLKIIGFNVLVFVR
jgi:hypothetical protein